MSIHDALLTAQTALLWDHPFFGVLIMQLERVDATDDPRINTMATDGRKLYYHAPFVLGMTKQERIFVLAHEVMHNALEHHIRRQNRKPGRWNKACDYVINLDLTEAKVGTMPACGLIDKRFAGMGAEEVYRILDEENNGDDSDEGQGDIGGCGGTLDACAPYDEAAKAELRAEMQTQIRQAAMAAKSSGQGTIPANIQRIIDELLAPKVDWRSVLRRFIDESSRRDYSWARPNRRLLPFGFITPGSISDGISHITIAADTSGSIDATILKDFGGEINGAFNEGAVDQLAVIYADAAVHRIEEYEAGDNLELRPEGGGGTAFSDSFRQITKRFPETRAVIYLTDMHVTDFGEDPGMPVLWGVYGRTKDFSKINAPFGELINISV